MKKPLTVVSSVMWALLLSLQMQAAENDFFEKRIRPARDAWIWRTPSRQSVPQVEGHSAATDVDRFLYAKLESKGLGAAGPADEATWLRRVHFAITGLPPTRDDLQTFLADTKIDAGARERVVDRLLGSPHFGERWARHWMDLMRYAESRGHESDFAIANAWQYRDYLIRAFNSDVLYKQFVLEHVAGDLLPAPRLQTGSELNESVLATGWAFLGEEVHSPVDIRQDECERIDNKVDVFSKTFLGLTVSCARCHDHKFDPIRTDDYYALAGFMLGSSFRQVRFEAMENNRKMAAELADWRGRYAPRLLKSVIARRESGVAGIAENLMAAAQALTAGGLTEGAPAKESARLQPWLLHLSQAATNPGALLHRFATAALDSKRDQAGRFAGGTPAPASSASVALPKGARVIADYTQADAQPWKVDGEAFGSRPLRVGEVVLGMDTTNPVAKVMPYGAATRDVFWNRLKAAPGNENDSGRLGATGRAGQMLRTPTVTLGVGKIHVLLKGKARVYAAVDSHLMNEGPLHGQLAQTMSSGMSLEPLWVTQDLSSYSGHRMHLEFGPDGAGELEVLMAVESADQPTWRPSLQLEPGPSVRSLSDFAHEIQAAAAGVLEAVQRGDSAVDGLTSKQALLLNWLVQNSSLFEPASGSGAFDLAREFVAGQSAIASRVRWESRTAVSWFDGTGVDEFVLVRGKPFKQGALSPRSLPVAFATAKPIDTSVSSGRYQLAQQLVDPTNPLLSRTIVNRVWHHVFVRGIVPTVDNFGALGEPPTHPELLDHLAWQFMHEDGWSVKRLIRRLVLTEAFARSSHIRGGRNEEIDPANVFLHRMPVRRLEGEAIRDALLAVSGRLNPIVGGPPVPVHLTEFLVGRGRPEGSGPLDGDGRRSVYTAMRRNFIPTLMQTFDMPTPFSTVGKRNVTNVPAQSLALMNDPLFHEQSAVWARRLLRETQGADAVGRIRWLYETAYARLPGEAEIQACLDSLGELRRLHGAADQESVEVWGDLCHALLNANDFIYLK
ncbi:MAG: DUF1553 domain-containing protein [Verrucomicrobiales bacterium]|nr:DUF1553 domain-containing protein [Verrucomicrobiales bacterium]